MSQFKSRGKKKKRRTAHKAGQLPGSVVYGGENGRESVLRGVRYDAVTFEEKPLANASEVKEFLGQPGVKWVNLDGLSDTKLLEEIGRVLELHSLVLEDIANTQQRTKIEEDNNQFVLFLRDFDRNSETHGLEDSQVAIALGEDFVFTFCEREPTEFTLMLGRLASNQGIARSNGADYLVYRMLDLLVDQYFVMLDDESNKLDQLQAKIMDDPTDRGILSELLTHVKNFKRSDTGYCRCGTCWRHSSGGTQRSFSREQKRIYATYMITRSTSRSPLIRCGTCRRRLWRSIFPGFRFDRTTLCGYSL